ncbi:helix-turn-helix transcriptional regulator [Gluconacetobacter takamatsuzukensis]|uniref:Addiction module antidote protein, HigA family n=1 Tax=Gluconacetobacter takamatsuzukensis TaxID=1286190 RepID=A0A7W4PQL7_9PROT|nr:addiction module antidote protein, HigA family [Gluconacetobacter takamatsuzukensis]MBB2206513.1 addiction module antidote protein, HigA family [Gluconacetobacter takamatsuzukensis]
MADGTNEIRLDNVTMGAVLREEFLAPLGLSARALAAETAILPGERSGTTAEFWMNLQVAHDLEAARRQLARSRAHRHA